MYFFNSLCRYWAVALPAYIIVLVLLGYFTYIASVFINTPSLDSLSIFTGNEHTGSIFVSKLK